MLFGKAFRAASCSKTRNGVQNIQNIDSFGSAYNKMHKIPGNKDVHIPNLGTLTP